MNSSSTAYSSRYTVIARPETHPLNSWKGVSTLSLVCPGSLPYGQIRTKEKYRTLNGLPALMACASGISERRIYHENNYSLSYPQIISRVFNCLYYKYLWYLLCDSSSNNLPVNLITTTMSGPHSPLVFLIISGSNPHNFQKQKSEKWNSQISVWNFFNRLFPALPVRVSFLEWFQ